VLLALRGPREVVPRQPTAYTLLARACPGGRGRALRRIRFFVRGPQRLTWLLRRLPRTAAARRTLTLTFPAPADPRVPATVTLEARSARGSLL
jgi:hypothetical protein